MYRLIAQNKSGASVDFVGDSQKSVIDQFDSEYRRKGFIIEITDSEGETVRIIKSTYR